MTALVMWAIALCALALVFHAGAAAYVGWRTMRRQDFSRDKPHVYRALYGEYESPFPWHRSVERERRDTAA